MSSDPYAESLSRSSRRSRSARFSNPLLLRQPIGKAKPTTYALPPSSFTYGGRNQMDEYSVREVLSHWEVSQPSESPSIPTVSSSSPNFISLNRSAIQGGAASSKDITQYRRSRANTSSSQSASHSLSPSPTRRSRSSIPSAVLNSNRAFGRPSKPSTPIHDILNNTYQRQSILARREQEKREFEKKKSKVLNRREPSSPTRASLGHVKIPNQQLPGGEAEHHETKKNDQRFIMSRFANIPPKVETYRFSGGKTRSQEIDASTSQPVETQAQVQAQA